MAEKAVSEKALRYMELLNRETGNRHHTDTEDMRQYEGRGPGGGGRGGSDVLLESAGARLGRPGAQ